MKSNFTEGRYGYAFKNGKLYWFTKRHVMVMTPCRDGFDPSDHDSR